MSRIILISFFAFLTIKVSAQFSDSLHTRFVYKNSVQTELFGNGLLYSFSYERVLLNGPKFKTLAQAGFSVFPIDIGYQVIINELLSFNKNHIELGVGYARFWETDNGSDSWRYLTGRLGYRYQKPDGKFVFRIGFTPILFLENGNDPGEFKPWGGMTFGYNFGRR